MDVNPLPPTQVDVLAKAIRRRSVVAFTYNNEQIVAEPIVLGIHKETNKHVLRCYKSFPPQLADKKENWYLCDLDKISNLKITPMRSKDHRNGGSTLKGDLSEVIVSAADYVKG